MLLPDDSTMKATCVGTLNIDSLPIKARIARMFPAINKSLLSILATFDEGGEVRFIKKEFYITCKGSIVLKGKRDYETGLWSVPT